MRLSKPDVNFNPRSHERSDAFIGQESFAPGISIHAPTRGATFAYKPKHWEYEISIHAPTRGATMQSLNRLQDVNFNPRSHERSDEITTISTRKKTYFNPRSHERSDETQDVFGRGMSISIHAPTRGATGFL